MKKHRVDTNLSKSPYAEDPGDVESVVIEDRDGSQMSLTTAEETLMHWQKEQRVHVGNMAERILHVEATFLRHNMPDKAAFARHYSGLFINEQGHSKKAIAQFERNLEYFEQQRNETWQFKSLNSLGSAYVSIGEHVKSCKALLRALSIARRKDSPLFKGIALHNLARVYHLCDWFELARKYYSEAYRMRSRAGDLHGAALTRCSLAQIYSELGDHDRALDIFEQAITVDKAIVGNLLAIKIRGSIAKIHVRLGRTAVALNVLEQMRADAAKFGVPYFEMNARVEMGLIYRELGDHRTALRILNAALPELLKLDIEFALCRLYDGLYQAYRSLGMAQEALNALELYTKAKERTLGVSQSGIISALNARFELAQLHKTIQQEEMHNAQLQSEVERQSKTLAIQALYLTQTRAALERARHSLADVQAEFGPDQRAVDALQSIENAHDLDARLSAFEREFFHVRHSFIQKLQRRYPQLRPAEIKVCALMTLGLATKEIAALLCLSQRTIEQHRYRARKKIGLAANENLKIFLNGL